MLQSIHIRNYTNAFGALGGMNACLPKEYQVDVSTVRYQEATKTNLIVQCRHCKKEFKRTELKILNITTSLLESIFTGSNKMKRWVCIGCHRENRLSNTKMVQEKSQNPQFFRVVPDPPQRQNGLSDRNSYHGETENWIWKCLAEIDYQAAKYRTDNWNREETDPDEDDVETSEAFDT